jgi:hypothetical protein
MNRLKHLVPYSALKSLNFTLEQSHFDYAELVYLNTLQSNNIIPLQKIQNKADRVLKSFKN